MASDFPMNLSAHYIRRYVMIWVRPWIGMTVADNCATELMPIQVLFRSNIMTNPIIKYLPHITSYTCYTYTGNIMYSLFNTYGLVGVGTTLCKEFQAPCMSQSVVQAVE